MYTIIMYTIPYVKTIRKIRGPKWKPQKQTPISKENHERNL